MTRADTPSEWLPTQSFAVTTTPRRRKLTTKYVGIFGQGTVSQDRLTPVDYVEISNLQNKGPVLYVAFNGTTATATLATGPADPGNPTFKIIPDSIERILVRATSVSILATAATTIFITCARF